MNRFIGHAFVVLLFSCVCVAQKAEKLTSEAIIVKHLASVGTSDALAAVKSRLMVGTGVFTAKNNPGKVGGAAQLASSGDNFLLVMLLNANNYPYEKLAFDGKELTTGILPSGNSSPLGGFLKSNKLIVKNGLLGGVLSLSWPFLHADQKASLESAGIAKVGDRSLYKLKYTASGIGEMTISFYFEPNTFRHVRTEYFYRTGQLASPDRVGGFAPNTYELTEEFSNFTKVDNLVLPLGYVLEFTTDAGRTMTWSVSFVQVYNNQPIDASAFRVS